MSFNLKVRSNLFTVISKSPCTPIAPLQRGKTLSLKECPRYDTKQPDDEVPMMLEVWGMQRTPSLPSLPGPLRLGMIVPDLWVK